jgi:putative addiction module component (TIGR02574 family)
MSSDLDDLLKKAMALPEEARAALAGRLIESLDADVDEGIEADWSREIASRLAEFDSGAVKAVPWAEARARILNGK